MKFISLDHIWKATASVFSRFPICVLFSVLITLCFFIKAGDYYMREDSVILFINRLSITSIIGFLGALSIYVYSESWSSIKFKVPLFISLFLGLLILFNYLPERDILDTRNKTTTIVAGLFVLFHLLISYIPYFKNEDLIQDFWNYNRSLLFKFLEASFFAGVICVGLNLAVAAMDLLFDLTVENNIFLRVFIFSACLFHPIYFLSQFPKEYTKLESLIPWKSYLIFCKYIILPIVGLYFIILYAYVGKIGFQWSLPKGWVSQLVLWFSVSGILAYLLNYYNERFDDSPIITFFKKWYFFILIPLILLLFLAIGVRISNYGLTEPRYIVAALGIWLFIVGLYFIISTKDDIRFIPISLSVIVFISVFGPWNMRASSIRNQESILESKLITNNLLSEGRLTAASDDIDHEEKLRIVNILNYLDTQGRLSILNQYKMDNLSITDTTTVYDIRTYLNISHLDNLDPVHGKNVYFNGVQNFDIDLSEGYDHMISFNKHPNLFSKEGYYILFENDQGIIYNQENKLCSFSMKPTLENADNRIPHNTIDPFLEQSFTCNEYSGKLIIQQLSYNIKDGISDIMNAEGIILLKKI